MFNLAICDDDPDMLQKLYTIVTQYFTVYHADFKIKQFTSGIDLLGSTYMTTLDLIFLDINMPQMSGMDVAAKLRAINNEVEIIFVSKRQDMMGKAIHYRPFRFIEKINMYKDLPEAIEAYIQKISNEILLLEFDKITNQPIKIRVKDILYLESIGHQIEVNYIERNSNQINLNEIGHRKAEFRGNLYEFEERWAMLGFVKTSKSYLVNIQSVKTLSRQGFIMDNNNILPISRKYYDHVKDEYYRYVRKYIE